MPENYRGINYETILAWVEDGIGYLQFNRPKAFNAVNYKLLLEATEALNFFSEDPEVKAIIVCGNENAFAAGADLKAVVGYTAFEARDFLDKVHLCMFALEDNHKPTVAAVRGLASGWWFGNGYGL